MTLVWELLLSFVRRGASSDDLSDSEFELSFVDFLKTGSRVMFAIACVSTFYGYWICPCCNSFLSSTYFVVRHRALRKFKIEVGSLLYVG